MELASLEIRISRSENLPVLPQAVSSVLRMADSPNVSPRQLAQCIERDPAITAKVLRAANSAYYGFSNVNTVGRAISCLGMNSIRSLVISVALQNMLSGRSQSQSFNKIEFWKHSLASATACRVIATMTMPGKADELYCAGMMHDVGYIAMDKFMPRELDDCVRTAKATGRPLRSLCLDVIGFDVGMVGSILADRWALPRLIKQAISFHSDPEMDGDYFETTCIVHAGDVVANNCGFNMGLPGVESTIMATALESIGIPEMQWDAIMGFVTHEVDRAMQEMRIR